MDIIGVVYNGKFYKAKFPVRESLFYELKECDPDREIEIIHQYSGVIKRVPLRDLDPWSVVRHL